MMFFDVFRTCPIENTQSFFFFKFNSEHAYTVSNTTHLPYNEIRVGRDMPSSVRINEYIIIYTVQYFNIIFCVSRPQVMRHL